MKSFRPFLFLLIFFFILGLGVSWISFQKSIQNEKALFEKKFQDKTVNFLYALEERYYRNQLVLESTTGFFAASDSVSNQEWNTYIKEMNLTKKFPAMQWVSFIQYVPQSEKETFTSSFHQKGNPSFHIWPQKDVGDIFTLIYIYPSYFSSWIGFDFSTRAMQKKIFEKSVRENRVEASKAFSLHSLKDSEGSFFFLLPIFKGNKTPFGWVVALIDFSELINIVMDESQMEKINLEVFTGKETLKKNLVFQKISTTKTSSKQFKKELNLGDLYWTFVFSNQKTSKTTSLYPFFILSSTLLFMTALTFLFYFVVKKTNPYKDLKEEDKTTFLKGKIPESLQDALFTTEPDGIINFFNPSCERILDYKAKNIVGKESPLFFSDPEDIKKKAAEFSQLLSKEVKPDFSVFQAILEKKVQNNQTFIFVRRDKKKISFVLRLSAILDLEKNLLGYLFLILEKETLSENGPSTASSNPPPEQTEPFKKLPKDQQPPEGPPNS